LKILKNGSNSRFWPKCTPAALFKGAPCGVNGVVQERDFDPYFRLKTPLSQGTMKIVRTSALILTKARNACRVGRPTGVAYGTGARVGLAPLRSASYA